jgi:hypothetical protein
MAVRIPDAKVHLAHVDAMIGGPVSTARADARVVRRFDLPR